MTWMRLPKEYAHDESEFLILPVSYEKDLTYGQGCRKGPLAIIDASEHLEYYDEQFDCEAFLLGIRQLPTLDLAQAEPQTMMQEVTSSIKKNYHHFLLGLGGDHACTIAFVKGLEESCDDDFSVVVLDAHSDFRDSWGGPFNHACVSKQLSKKHDVALLGVRSQDVDEAKQIEALDNVHVIKAYDFDQDHLQRVLSRLKEKVYISIDVDVFDPSIISHTGTPEPGGFDWNTIIGILKIIFESKQVIGADIVEFAPRQDSSAQAYTLAKLAYKLMSLHCLSKKEL